MPLPGVRQRLLLAMLLVNANRTVPAVRLIDELWGADLPADPRAALRTQVSRLRRALGPAGGIWPPWEVVTAWPSRAAGSTSTGSRTRWPRRPRASGEPALRLLDEAVALYRGPVLGELADRPFAHWPSWPGWRNCV